MLNGKTIPEASASAYADMLSYARSPACAAAFGNYSGSCCGLQECFFDPTYVEVYYWPAEDADTSCLSVIGDSVKPWDYGATLTTTTEVITTAVMTSVNGFTFKSSVYNPWGQDNPCVTTSSTSETPVFNSSGVSEYKMRARSLVKPVDPAGNITVPVNKVTLDGYTFTSPSVYVNFIGLQAKDDCGPLRTASSMYTTMIAFDADELSTVVGGGNIYFQMQKLAPFNVADLPCPPQSIMVCTPMPFKHSNWANNQKETNWYKPAPGEPYIPRLAFPSRLKTIDPLWASCEPGLFFTAYDPPRTLVPVSAVSPDTTVAHPGSTSSPYPDGNDPIANPTAAPESTPELSQPKQTATRVTNPGDSNSHSSLPKPIATQGSSSNDGSGSNADPVDVPNDAEGTRPTLDGGDPGNGIDHGGPSHTVPVDASNRSPTFITSLAGHAATLLPPIVAIGSTTLTHGALPITISGTAISFGSAALVVGSKTLPLPQSQQVVTSVAGHGVTFVPNAVAIGGTTLTPGGAPVTLSGITISLESSAIVVAPMSLPLTHVGQVISNFAGSPATILPANAVAIAGTSLRPGDPPLTISGMVLSISSTFLMMGAQAIPFAQLPSVTTPAGRATITAIAGDGQSDGITVPSNFVGGTLISLLPNGDLVIGATTLSRGGPAATLDGTQISIAPDGNLVIDSTTIRPGEAGMTLEGSPISVATDGSLIIDDTTLIPGGAAVNFGETPISFAADGIVVISGKTLRPGDAAVTIHGTQFSVAADGGLVFDGTTLEPKTANSATYLGIGAMTAFRAAGEDLVLDGTTLSPGGAGLNMGGLSVSVAPDGELVIDGTTLRPGGTALTIAGVPISMAPDGELVVDGTTLRPADAGITIGANAIFIAANGHLVIDGTTLQPPSPGASTLTSNEDLLFDGSTLRPGGVGVTVSGTPVSVAPGGELVVNGTTLKPGDGFAIGGTTLAIMTDGQILVVNPTGAAGGLGSLIMGGFGAGPTGSSLASTSPSAGLVVFEGSVTRLTPTWNHKAVVLVAILVTMLLS
ncbi:hypothetical protein G7Y79_00002g007270 [Physcia stellaris]|nr:hypothetical protein G7Y79_00002g007270 [Physcia stellaris]